MVIAWPCPSTAMRGPHPNSGCVAMLIGVVCSARLFVFGAVDYGQLGEAAGIAAARNESRKSNRVIPQRAVDHRVDIAPTFAPSIAPKVVPIIRKGLFQFFGWQFWRGGCVE